MGCRDVRQSVAIISVRARFDHQPGRGDGIRDCFGHEFWPATLCAAIYLLWLAWQTARRGRPDLQRSIDRPTSFIGGMGLLWINPKGWAMTLSAAASFSALASGPAPLAALLGLTFLVLSATSLTLWCVAGVVLAKMLRTDAQWRALNVALGAALALSVLPIWLE